MTMSSKYLHQFGTIFGTIEHRDILNMPVIILINCLIRRDVTWQTTKTRYLVFINS